MSDNRMIGATHCDIQTFPKKREVRPQSSYINPIQRQAAPHTVHTSRRMSTSAPHRSFVSSFAPPRLQTRLTAYTRESVHLSRNSITIIYHRVACSDKTHSFTNASSSASSRDSSRPHCGAHHTRVHVTRACESSSRRPGAPRALQRWPGRRRQRCSAGAPQLWSLLWSSRAICFGPSYLTCFFRKHDISRSLLVSL